MFDLDQCIAECREALAEGDARQAVHDIVARAVSDPAAILRAVGEPERAGLHRLHHTPELTVLNVVWGPYMTLMPHDHRMWAVIGVYTGAEDNIFWRRDGEALKAAGARALREGDVKQLGADAIHSVTNPVDRLTGAIHVYGCPLHAFRPLIAGFLPTNSTEEPDFMACDRVQRFKFHQSMSYQILPMSAS